MTAYPRINTKVKTNSPFYIFYPEMLKKKIDLFQRNFNGKILYAVKANPSNFIIDRILKSGVNAFDVASISEVKLIRANTLKSEIYFMNPVKARCSINEAYTNYKVKNFCIDSFEELKKIDEETNNATDISCQIRVEVPNNWSAINLSKKFGINKNEAPKLLRKLENKCQKIGLSFHVGSQCMNPSAYEKGLEILKNVILQSEVRVDSLNIGGGFPSNYENYNSPSLIKYFSKINNYISRFQKDMGFACDLLAEPGRSLVSECMSLIVQVILRKKNHLFINDGVHGSLNNAGYHNFNYPVRLLNNKKTKSDLIPFSLYGPTCDSNDFMKGPFYLPRDVSEGDYIEIRNMGAYSISMMNNFNGFSQKPKIFKLKEPSKKFHTEQLKWNKLEQIT